LGNLAQPPLGHGRGANIGAGWGSERGLTVFGGGMECVWWERHDDG
jgi:hypothetical protein